jgi:cyclase
MKRNVVLGLLVAAGLAVACYGTSEPGELQVARIKDTLFAITGEGGTTAVFIRGDGVVLVDTKITGNGQRILDSVRAITDKPITHILNTHTHYDHVGSNAFFPAGVEVVAHENAAARMVSMEEFEEPAAKHGLPDSTFKDTMTLFSGDEAIELRYFGAAHTGGDAFIIFRALGVMHVGDVFQAPDLPSVDGDNGGSKTAFPQTLANAVAGIRGVETIIPGHGPVTTWQAFVDYAEFVRNAWAR